MIVKPKQALNKAYLKVKPTRDQIKLFKDNLIKLIDEVNLDKREELHKNDFSDFLKDTYYKTSNYINIKDTIDLVVHSSIDPQSPVSILIEAKSPANKTEMISSDCINTKSMQELILYYLRERISNNNLNLKHLIITNRYEWFIFDAALFEKLFAQNKQLVNQFNDFEDKTLSVTKTKDFYSEIAKPVIEAIKDKVEYTYFDIREYKKYLENNTPENDSKLIPLYKIFSPEHLLKLPIANDNNSLDKSFYNELLHIIGLEETKQGSKKIITRKEVGRRDNGSLLENCITELDNGDKLSSITNIEHYGTTKEERLFNVALELVIIWINRILFLKLLEGQLINFNKNSKDYAFLNSNTIKGYDDLNNLFFGVLAKQQNERSENNKKLFAKIPYLNSSLFDPQSESLEKSCFAISALNYNRTLPIDTKTILKDRAGKKLAGEKNALEYLFEFLNAYNFASDSNDEIQEDSKTIINAAVLGLIFEKINGYKDGSFYTPSFITMYMCRETIRRAVVEQFNKAKSWNCLSFDELYNKIEDRNEANNIINSITICDPAVGSGHFLVSALNEIIAIKSELRILQDSDGKRLKEYQVEIVNDELIVTDEEGDLFVYNPNSKESQRVQITLFHEKQTIIENCLFGVDINPNSVKICRLRLWIELLKNTYYKNKENHELETLPNIDINIKCGNSLISRFDLDSDLIEPLKKAKIKISDYKEAVQNYRHARDKQQKMEMAKFIERIKNNFETEIMYYDKRSKNLEIKQAQLNHLSTDELFATTQKVQKEKNKKIEKLKNEVSILRKEIDEIKSNKIYESAFEWRFEFPEVLADNGDFIGFDVVIGNPPYISALNMKRDNAVKGYFKTKFKFTNGTYDIYALFVELIKFIGNINVVYSYIIPNKFLIAQYAKDLLNDLKITNSIEYSIDLSQHNVFEEASVYPIIIFGKINDSKTFRNLMVNNLDDFIKENILNEIKPLKTFKTLKDYGILIQSGLAGFQAESIKPYLSEESNSHNIDFIVSGCVDRFSYMNKNVRYMGMKYESCFIDINCPLSSEKLSFWTNPKIVIAGMTKNIEAVYIEKPMGLGVGVYGIYNLEQDMFYLLVAILNSKFISYYFKVKFKDKTLSGGYLAINKNTIQDIPFVDIDDDKKEQLILLSKKINDSNIDHSTLLIIELEKQIDQLVYELYGLTDDEIKIIEAN
ncbi:MAG: class I SAM-dependent DNA methyltransferase [Neisseriales bacterium]|nr:MAG: class I SAM-dependent DNA methyltransferase [Neisseriales bacterium]